MRRALLIVGKAPAPGHTKTRLAATLSPGVAAALARAFLLDTVALALDLGWEQVSLIHPAGDGPGLAALLPARVRLCQQRTAGLGAALAEAFERHLVERFDRVVLIGSDTPSLPGMFVEAACAALEDHDLSIGPCPDGGYYLLALKRPYPRLFQDIDWSTSRVLAQTLARAAELALRVHILPDWRDVDAAEDLLQLQAELAAAPPGIAPHTRAVLDDLSVASLPSLPG